MMLGSIIFYCMSLTTNDTICLENLVYNYIFWKHYYRNLMKELERTQ